MLHIEAIYDHGVLRPVEPLSLPEGARVQLRLDENGVDRPADTLPKVEPTSLLDRLKDFVGTIDDLPADSSTNLDHYLYGHPKR
jgi:predicted DNA-binding antitoxin AbrB/MazE fold protein